MRSDAYSQRSTVLLVMPGLVPGIHVFEQRDKNDVDGRDKPGHDERKQLGIGRRRREWLGRAQ